VIVVTLNALLGAAGLVELLTMETFPLSNTAPFGGELITTLGGAGVVTEMLADLAEVAPAAV